MERPRRDIIAQPMLWQTVLVGLTPTPVSQAGTQVGLSAAYDSIIFSLVSTAAQNVFLGNANVTATGANGLEIRAGIPIQLSITNQRQMYEVQGPLVDQFCRPPDAIPFIVWDVSQMYLITSVGAKNIAVGLFKAAFI